jgi:hypothetical protein
MAEGEKKQINLQEYIDIINSVISDIGVNPDEVFNKPELSWDLFKGSAEVIIHIFTIEDTYFIDVRSSVCPIPTTNVLPFYRKILELNQYYVAVKFYVYKDWTWVSISRELVGMSKEEMAFNMNSVGNIADEWDDKLREEFFKT